MMHVLSIANFEPLCAAKELHWFGRHNCYFETGACSFCISKERAIFMFARHTGFLFARTNLHPHRYVPKSSESEGISLELPTRSSQNPSRGNKVTVELATTMLKLRFPCFWMFRKFHCFQSCLHEQSDFITARVRSTTGR